MSWNCTVMLTLDQPRKCFWLCIRMCMRACLNQSQMLLALTRREYTSHKDDFDISNVEFVGDCLILCNDNKDGNCIISL